MRLLCLLWGLWLLLTNLVLVVARQQPPQPVIGYLHVGTTTDIYYTTVEGNKLIRGTRNLLSEQAVTWSPDGRWIVFNALHQQGVVHLYRVSLMGAGLRILTDAPCFHGNPQWSPNGQWIAYHQVCEHGRQLIVMRPDGSQPRRLSENLPVIGSFSWSPDSQQLVFVVGEGDTDHDLYRVGLDGSKPSLVLHTPLNDFGPVWSPDGQQIVLHGWRDFEQWLFVMNADGSDYRRISNQSAYSLSPTWATDSSALYYIDNSAQTALIRAQPDGRFPYLLATRAWEPLVSADGRWVLFLQDKQLPAIVSSRGGAVRILPQPLHGVARQARWVNVPVVTWRVGLSIMLGLAMVGVGVTRLVGYA